MEESAREVCNVLCLGKEGPSQRFMVPEADMQSPILGGSRKAFGLGLGAQPGYWHPQVSFVPARVTDCLSDSTVNGFCCVTHSFSPVSEVPRMPMTGSQMLLPTYGAF